MPRITTLERAAPSRPLQGFPISPRLFHGDVAVPRTTLSGLRPPLEALRTAYRRHRFAAPSSSSSRPRGLPPSGRPCGPKTARRLPQAWPPSQGSGRGAVTDRARSARPSWGFAPLQRHGRRDPHDPGLPHPARSVLGVSHPLDGFRSLRPCGLAGSAAALGVSAPSVLSDGGAGKRLRLPCVLSPAVLIGLLL